MPQQLQITIAPTKTTGEFLTYDGCTGDKMSTPSVGSIGVYTSPLVFKVSPAIDIADPSNSPELNFVAWLHFPDVIDDAGNVWRRPVVLTFSTHGYFFKYCNLGYADARDPQSNDTAILKSGHLPGLKFGTYAATDKGIEIGIMPGDVPIDPYQTLKSGQPYWISDLLKDPRIDVKKNPITWLHLPGTHDSTCYKDRWFAIPFNTQTQELDLYEQCMLGIRSFDIRLYIYREANPVIVKTRHGPKVPGDLTDWGDPSNHPWSSDSELDPNKTMLGQLDSFYKDIIVKSSEFIVLLLKGMSDTWNDDGDMSQDHVDLLWVTFETYFKDKAIPRPVNKGDLAPQLDSIAGSKERFVLIWGENVSPRSTSGAFAFFNRYAWVPSYGVNAEGVSPRNYSEDAYKDGDVAKVTTFIEDHLAKANQTGSDQERPSSREQFFATQCQMTPSFIHKRPWDLIDSNTTMAQDNFRKNFWIQNTNILSVDYPTPELVERMLWMNKQLYTLTITGRNE